MSEQIIVASQPFYVAEYATFIHDLLHKVRPLTVDPRLCLVLGQVSLHSVAPRKFIRLGLQYEHCITTLTQHHATNIRDLYFVDQTCRGFANDQWILDYSFVNQQMARQCLNNEIGKNYVDRCLYFPPLYWSELLLDTHDRHIEILTTFVNPTERRQKLFAAENVPSGLLQNVGNSWGCDALRALYRNTKILLNIHQTDVYLTFEELRVLPALLCGVLVISEDVPFRHDLPFAQHILWWSQSSVPTLVEFISEVRNNYKKLHAQCFDKFHETVAKMEQNLIENAKRCWTD